MSNYYMNLYANKTKAELLTMVGNLSSNQLKAEREILTLIEENNNNNSNIDNLLLIDPTGDVNNDLTTARHDIVYQLTSTLEGDIQVINNFLNGVPSGSNIQQRVEDINAKIVKIPDVEISTSQNIDTIYNKILTFADTPTETTLESAVDVIAGKLVETPTGSLESNVETIGNIVGGKIDSTKLETKIEDCVDLVSTDDDTLYDLLELQLLRLSSNSDNISDAIISINNLTGGSNSIYSNVLADIKMIDIYSYDLQAAITSIDTTLGGSGTTKVKVDGILTAVGGIISSTVEEINNTLGGSGTTKVKVDGILTAVGGIADY